MKRGADTPEEKERKRVAQHEYRKKERELKGVVSYDRYRQNSMKIMSLSENQIRNLFDQLETYDIDHEVGIGMEYMNCVETTHPFRLKGVNGYGSYNPVFIHWRKLIPTKEDNPQILRSDGFPPGSIVLAYNGIFAKNPTDQISHLCDNPKCIKVNHLMWETSSENNNRKGCPGWIKCNCCDELHDVCIHTPKCIKITKRK